MAVDTLRCRVCETEYPAAREWASACAASGRSSRCTTGTTVAREATRESIEAGPRSLWRYEALLPAAAPPDAAGRARLDAARPGPAARRGARRRRGLPEARPREPDALLQGPRRRGRRGEGGRARHRHARLRVDRQPRQRGRRARRRERPALGRPLSARRSSRRSCSRPRSTAATMYAVRGSYDDCSPARRRAGRRARLGVRERQPARLLRGGLEDARVRDRRAARLGDARRGRSAPVASGSLLHEALAGLRAVPRASGSSTGARPRIFGGQAAGLRARRVARSPTSGPSRRCARRRSRTRSRSARPADGDLADRDRARVGRRDLRRAGGRGRREHVAARRARRASSARPPPA